MVDENKLLFSIQVSYGCQIWGQHTTNLVKRVMKLQEKAIRLINFKGSNAQVSNLFWPKQNFNI